MGIAAVRLALALGAGGDERAGWRLAEVVGEGAPSRGWR
jgi:hypothetical protein